MKRTVAAALMCLLIGAFSSAVCDTEAANWKIGHVRPTGSAVDLAIQAFAGHIKDKTDGAIQFDIYAANKLGDYSVVQERVSLGEVEMFVGPFGTAVDKRVALAFIPFLVSTWDDAQKLYARDSILFEQMAAFLQNQNIQLIGGWPVYFGGIALTAKPDQPGNPEISKEMIIRVPPIRSFELTARALGFTPYPITWAYAKIGLKTGMVEGILGGGAEGYLGLAGTVTHYLPVRDHFEYWFVYINLALWKSLSEENRTILVGAARDMEKQRYAVAEQDERDSIRQLGEKGIEVIELTEAQQAQMKKKVRQMVWPVVRADIGEAFDPVVQVIEPDYRPD
jgi:TRAP-type C4-dicarboxylate transport system substrate-binding protein